VTGLVVPDAGQDPAGYVLAVADLREKRAKAETVPQGEWLVNTQVYDRAEEEHIVFAANPDEPYSGDDVARAVETAEIAVLIAAEGSPAHALAEVALWRLIATKHRAEAGMFPPVCSACAPTIEYDEDTGGETEFLPLAPCELLLAVVAAARAYLGGQ
jgi:hypothetical protein